MTETMNFPDAVTGHERITALMDYAKSLYEKDMLLLQITLLVKSANKNHCTPPLDDDTVEAILSEAVQRPGISDVDIAIIREENKKLFPELPELPGFFKRFTEYGTAMSYAYPAYHFGSALALVSMIAGRKVLLVSTAGATYLNMYIMDIGQTSTSGKSTASGMANNEFFPDVRIPGTVEELPDKMTPQGFIQRLSEIPTRFWYYDECSEFFSDTKNQISEAMINLMCKVYEVPRTVAYGLSRGGRDKQSDYVARYPYLTLLWNTTDTEIEHLVTRRHVTSGLIPRMFWIWCTNPAEPRENRARTPDDDATRAALSRDLLKLKTIIGKIPEGSGVIFKPSAIIEKHRLAEIKSHRAKDDEYYNVATARLIPQTYKIAMMFCLMDKGIQERIKDFFTSSVPATMNTPGASTTAPAVEPQQTLPAGEPGQEPEREPPAPAPIQPSNRIDVNPETGHTDAFMELTGTIQTTHPQPQWEQPEPEQEPPAPDPAPVLELAIPDEYAQLALEICEVYTRPRLMHIIGIAINNDNLNIMNMIEKSIKKHDGVAKREQIIQDTRIPQKKLNEAIDTMIEGNMIEELFLKKQTAGRPALVYRLVSKK